MPTIFQKKKNTIMMLVPIGNNLNKKDNGIIFLYGIALYTLIGLYLLVLYLI